MIGERERPQKKGKSFFPDFGQETLKFHFILCLQIKWQPLPFHMDDNDTEKKEKGKGRDKKKKRKTKRMLLLKS